MRVIADNKVSENMLENIQKGAQYQSDFKHTHIV